MEDINDKNYVEDDEPVGGDSNQNDDGKVSGMKVRQGDSYRIVPLSGMFENWFLDYASYVILDRAVPDINDGLKPVQRRVLHSMREIEDGRFNKVANIVGNTMKYHPHGDASIYAALVNIGQKDLLVDCQGNWGNILTGDGAAAPRYIEARLSKFALDVVFNPKTTDWQSSYDGRNKEPIALPVKFPLLLSQGAMGIAVGLKSEILPHNFNELIDASISYLKDEPFALYPDFPTGGLIDVRSYNDGAKGAKIQVRAKISQLDKKTLVITEIPYGTTTGSLIESITKAGEKGQIKIKKVDDNTARNAEIVIQLAQGVSPDQTIDALYAFTLCQVSLNSLCTCVIKNDHPVFTTISDILKSNTDRTVELLSWELQIRLDELESDWHWTSLEKIFFEKGIYKELERKDLPSWDDTITAIERRFDPYRKLLRREVTRDEVLKLCEKPVRKISIFDIKKADEKIQGIEDEIEKVKYNLDNIVDYTIDFYLRIKEKYGKGRERKSEIRNFDNISAVAVAANNEKLYVDKEEGFICTSAGLRKEQDKDKYTFVCDCSDLDDVIVFREDGTYKVTKIQPKCFVGEKLLYVNVFHKNDERTIYNVAYRDGKPGNPYYVKRFAVKGITHDRDYDLTCGAPGSKVVYFSANPNGEAESLKVMLRPQPKLKRLTIDYDFATLAIKGRNSRGNKLTAHAISRIIKRDDGVSTLSAREIWYDDTVRRLNVDGRGVLVGRFMGDDKILHIHSNGEFRITGYDLSTHFDDDMTTLFKFDPETVFTVLYVDAETQLTYIKRFSVDDSIMNKRISFIGEGESAKFLAMNDDALPRLLLKFNPGVSGKVFEAEVVNVAEYIGVKSYKAKGKRLSTHDINAFEFIEPFDPQPNESQSDEPQNEERRKTEEAVNETVINAEEQAETGNPDTEKKDTESGTQMSLF